MKNDLGSQIDRRIEIIILDPRNVRLFHTSGSALRVSVEAPSIDVSTTFLRCQVARAFPWRYVDQWIGIRDENDNDIGMLESIVGLDSESTQVLHSELARRYFIPTIIQVHKATKEYETVTWDVLTDKGKQIYHVHQLRESVHKLDDGRIVITDRHGSRFAFSSIQALDKQSFSILERVLG